MIEELKTHPAAPPTGRLIVKRNGHSITRQIPKPVVLIDTREKYPFDFSRFPNWITESKNKALKAGDYSVEGIEELLILERKTLTDLITTVMQQRVRFFKQCEKMSKYRWKALLIEASYEDIKTPYDQDEYETLAHPNGCLWNARRFGSPLWHPGDLHFALPSVSRGKGRKLVIQALHILVSGRKRLRPRFARRGFVESFLKRNSQ